MTITEPLKPLVKLHELMKHFENLVKEGYTVALFLGNECFIATLHSDHLGLVAHGTGVDLQDTLEHLYQNWLKIQEYIKQNGNSI
jgi:hypothetical protein